MDTDRFDDTGSGGQYSLQFHDRMEPLNETWLEIERGNGHDSVLHDFDLVRQWYQSFNERDSPVLCSLWQGAMCLGVYPLLLEKRHGIRILKNLGIDTFSISLPLVRKEFRSSFFRSFLTALCNSRFPWHGLKLSYVPSYFCGQFSLDAQLFDSLGLQHHEILDPTYCVDLQGSFEEYLATYLSKNTRKNFKYLNRKLEQRDARLAIYRGDEALDHWDTFLDIENDGWKGAQGSSIAQMPPFKAYCDQLVRTLARHDKLYLCFLELEETPIAGSLFYAEDGVINEMKTGYSVRYKDYSPSNILLVRMVRHIPETMPEIRLWNTYPGSYGYKEKFTHARESFITFVLPNRTPLSRLMFGAYRMKMRYLERKRSHK